LLKAQKTLDTSLRVARLQRESSKVAQVLKYYKLQLKIIIYFFCDKIKEKMQAVK